MLSADALADRIDGLVHLDTQRAPDGIDLTVSGVFRTAGPGQLDFGGGEFEPAARERLEPDLADPSDDYGWWPLDEGAYVVEYNEAIRLGDGERGIVTPLERTLRAGAHHATAVVHGRANPLQMLLVVPAGGCRLKENCRLSRLRVEEG
jgi:deoxycytidine triphosphate deaminase